MNKHRTPKTIPVESFDGNGIIEMFPSVKKASEKHGRGVYNVISGRAYKADDLRWRKTLRATAEFMRSLDGLKVLDCSGEEETAKNSPTQQDWSL